MSGSHEERNALFLIAKYLKSLGGFDETIQVFQNEMGMRGDSLGIKYHWDGTASVASVADVAERYPQTPSSQLVELQRAALASREVSEDAFVMSTLWPLKHQHDTLMDKYNQREQQDNDKVIDLTDASDISGVWSCSHLNNVVGSLHLRELGVRSIPKTNKPLFGKLDVCRHCVSSYQLIPRQLSHFNKLKRDVHLMRPLWSCLAHMQLPVFCGVFDRTSHYLITGADDYLVKIWDVHTGLLAFTCRGHHGEISIIAVSWDNAYFASACTTGMIRIWRLSDAVCVKVLKHKSSVTWLSFDRCSAMLLSVGEDGDCIVWDAGSLTFSELTCSTGSPLWDMDIVSRGPNSVPARARARGPSSSSSSSCSLSSHFLPDDIDGGQEVVVGGGGAYAPSSINWRINPFDISQRVVGAAAGEHHCLALPHFSDSRNFQLLTHASHSLSQSAEALPESVQVKCMSLHPSGQFVVTGSSDGIGRLWQVGPEQTLIHRRSMRGSSSSSASSSSSSSSSSAASLSSLPGCLASPAYSFALDRISERLLLRLEGHLQPITDICFNSAGDRLLTGSILDGTARIWSFSANFGRCEQLILSVVDSSDQQVMAQSMSGGLLSKLHNRRVMNKKKASNIELSGACWSQGDRTVVTLQSLNTTNSPAGGDVDASTGSGISAACRHCKIKVWNAATGQLLNVFDNEDAHVRGLGSPIDAQILITHPVDDSILLTAGKDGLLTIWDAHSLQSMCQHRLTARHLQVFDRHRQSHGYLSDDLDHNHDHDLDADSTATIEILDAAFSEDGMFVCVTDVLGRVSVYGFSSPDRYARAPTEQYFSTDYAETVHDEHGMAIDLNTQLPVSECPRGLLCAQNGTPHDFQPYRVLDTTGDEDGVPIYVSSKLPAGPVVLQETSAEYLECVESRERWVKALTDGSFVQQLQRSYDEMSKAKSKQYTFSSGNGSTGAVGFAGHRQHQQKNVPRAHQAPSSSSSASSANAAPWNQPGDGEEYGSFEYVSDSDAYEHYGFHRISKGRTRNNNNNISRSNSSGGRPRRQSQTGHSRQQQAGAGRGDYLNGTGSRSRRNRVITEEGDDEDEEEQENGQEDINSRSRWAVFTQDISDAQRRDRAMRRQKREQRKRKIEVRGDRDDLEDDFDVGVDTDDDMEMDIGWDSDGTDSDDRVEIEGSRKSSRINAGKRMRRERYQRLSQALADSDQALDSGSDSAEKGSGKTKKQRSGQHDSGNGADMAKKKQRPKADGQKLTLRIDRQSWTWASTRFERSWLQCSHAIECQYVPQCGDSVYYVPQGHREYLQQYPDKGCPPWLLFPVSWSVVRCVVLDVQYQLPTYKHSAAANNSVLACISLCVTQIPLTTGSSSARGSGVGGYPFQLVFVEPRVTRHAASQPTSPAISFQVTLRNSELPDFLIPAHLMHRTISTPFRLGMRVKAKYKNIIMEGDDLKSMASLAGKSEAELEEIREDGFLVEEYAGVVAGMDLTAASPWDALIVRWDSTASNSGNSEGFGAGAAPLHEAGGALEGDRISPWEATLIEFENVVSKNLIAKLDSFQPPTLDANFTALFLAEIERLSVAEMEKFQCFEYPVDPEVFPDYYVIVPVYMCVDLIRKRLQRCYYRQFESLLFDIRLIASNCILYNAPGASIIDWASELSEAMISGARRLRNECVGGISSASEHNDGIPVSVDEIPSTEMTAKVSDEVSLANGIPTSAVEQVEQHRSSPTRRSTRSAGRAGLAIQQFNTRNASATPSQATTTEVASAATSSSMNPALLALQSPATAVNTTDERSSSSSAPAPVLAPGSLSQLSQSQAKRMDPQLRGDLLGLVNFVDSVDVNHIFRDPITEAIAPCYFDIVQCPMDTTSIRNKIAKRAYSSLLEGMQDVVLMFANCELYNDPMSSIVEACKHVRAAVRAQYQELYLQCQPEGADENDDVASNTDGDGANEETKTKSSGRLDKRGIRGLPAQAHAQSRNGSREEGQGRSSRSLRSTASHDVADPSRVSSRPTRKRARISYTDYSSGEESVDNTASHDGVDVEDDSNSDGESGSDNESDSDHDGDRSRDSADERDNQKRRRSLRTRSNAIPRVPRARASTTQNAQNPSGRQRAAEDTSPRDHPQQITSSYSNRSSGRRLDPELRSKMLLIVDSFDAMDEDRVFCDPVTEDIAPGYFDVIAQPMDTTTIRYKISARQYTNTDEVMDDIYLMLANCETYNDPSSDLCKYARRLRKFAKTLK